ncbi:MAG: hypothetical protein LBN32_00425 [Helicobacteraceae bacterium]|jgi:hypothetical protein|nr:hypothetical protein [Helicobacteraceae bacterium]
MRQLLFTLSISLKAFCGGAVILCIIGCAAPQTIIEYQYIDRNCSRPADIIAKAKPLVIKWVIVDLNTSQTRFYCTNQGASLLTNIRSCENE